MAEENATIERVEPLPSGTERGPLLLTIRNLVINGLVDDTTVPILRGIDLDVHRGEVIGLIGESGAGKSTLGLAGLGIVNEGCIIVDGSITFDGIDLRNCPESVKRDLRGVRVAYVAQSAAASFNPAHKMIDQVVESSEIHKTEPRKRAVERAVTLFGELALPDPARIGERYPHQVSGGQLQRLMTAMAMNCGPDLIIFDEPTTALDVTTQVEVLGAIRKVVQQFGTAAIYISHDLALVSQMAHRIVVLKDGVKVEEAETRRMLASPEHPYTRTLWAVRSLEKSAAVAAGPILDIRHINAAYGHVRVLEDVSFTVPRGHTVAVVGESGSGKSTLARVVCGLLRVEQGEVVFDGTRLPPLRKERTRDILRRIQLVYQSADTSMNPSHTVRTLLSRPLQLYFGLKGSAANQRVNELLDMIEMSGAYIDRYPSELSGGQKQRISIARALAANPDLIVCDEVTSALDQVIQEGILKLLMSLQKELSVSYLFITHDLATVKAIADEVAVMHRGRVVRFGEKNAVLSPPFDDYTQLLMSSVPQMDPDWLDGVIQKRTGESTHA
ncbi:ABC transporter ATP-binding protein [Mesorhizobium sp. LNHC229A00]|uniref:ABC transporter ATP-binding protein n=1 Tax=Mesorhizobium sp. LNHC229A00 TaxID=1287240 RepID=UPI0003CE79E1|nr:ABC transporter ATP-binding protein [Mesorhizobium sp. LNHC229A00]ESY89484.1 ABC transporter [Mesorhizobium sp. LNHC229A00]